MSCWLFKPPPEHVAIAGSKKLGCNPEGIFHPWSTSILWSSSSKSSVHPGTLGLLKSNIKQAKRFGFTPSMNSK